MTIAFSLTKFKKALLFLFFAVIFLLTPQIALAATLTLNPATGTVNRGCNFSVNVDMNAQGAQTDGTDAIIKYDPTRFTATTITNGSIYPDYPGNSIDQTGRINISGLASPETAFSGSGTLATINFVVAQNAPTGTTTLTFDFDPNNKQKTTDSNVVERGTIVDLLSSVTNGTYTVGTGACGSSTTITTGTGTGTGTTTTLTGTGVGGKGSLITDSSTSGVPLKELPQGAITGPTFVLMAVGGALTILGILGLALL